MNLVEQKNKYIKDREELVKKREELIGQLKDLEVSIERYNGAIVAVSELIKQEESEKAEVVTGEVPKMKIQK